MRSLSVALVSFALLASSALAGPWAQFHGPNATGLRADDDGGPPLPGEVAPDKNLLWRTPLAEGHSSPAVWGDRVFVTAADGVKLSTIALDAETGKVVWTAEAPHGKLEQVHQKGSLAQPSPATDGKIVASFFGSCGLHVYDFEGKPLWRLPMGPFNDGYGAGSSPVIVGDVILVCEDHDTDSFLMAVDKGTGKVRWKTSRAEFPRGYATPVLWDNGGKRQVVAAGTLRLVGYDIETGREAWTVRNLARLVNTTPVVGSDGMLYLSTWAPGGDVGERISMDPFDEILAREDRNGDGALQLEEIPNGQVRARFPQVDRNKDGKIDRAEYESMRNIFNEARNAALAIRPGGEGDVTATHVAWSQEKGLPYVPSPLFYRGTLFLVKNGGVFTSLDAKTGAIVKQARLKGKGDYFASPVGGDGKIFTISERGEVAVVSAEPQWNELANSNFDEDTYATPALSGGRIYVRTSRAVYAFGAPKP